MTVESVRSDVPQTLELPTPPLAGGGVPGLGHGWKLVRDPLGFLAQLRDHGDVVRLKMGPKTVYAVTTPDLSGAVALSPDFEIGGPLWESLEGLLGKKGSRPPPGRCTGANGGRSSPRSGSTSSPSTGRSWRRRRVRSRLAGSPEGRSTARRSRSASPSGSRPAACCAASSWTSGPSG